MSNKIGQRVYCYENEIDLTEELDINSFGTVIDIKNDHYSNHHNGDYEERYCVVVKLDNVETVNDKGCLSFMPIEYLIEFYEEKLDVIAENIFKVKEGLNRA